MSDITGNPTPLNVPAAQNANGTLTPKQGSSATPPTAQAAIGAPVNVASISAPPRAADNTATPASGAVPDMPYTGKSLVLESIAVTPANIQINDPGTQQFTATGTYSDGTESDITSEVAWTSSDDAIAAFSPDGAGGGLATAGDAGTVVVTATLANVSGTTNLTVKVT